MSSLLNKSAVRKLIMDTLTAKRPALGFTQVASEAFQRYETKLRELIEKDIASHPTVGKTFKPADC